MGLYAFGGRPFGANWTARYKLDFGGPGRGRPADGREHRHLGARAQAARSRYSVPPSLGGGGIP